LGSQRRKILTKELKSSGGNWGKPTKSEQKNVHIEDIPQTTKPRRKVKKKKKVIKKPWGPTVCPFCMAELPGGEVEDRGNEWIPTEERYASQCPKCDAERVDDCPCCHRSTWQDKSGIYKHQDWVANCGFTGKKK